MDWWRTDEAQMTMQSTGSLNKREGSWGWARNFERVLMSDILWDSANSCGRDIVIVCVCISDIIDWEMALGGE